MLKRWACWAVVLALSAAPAVQGITIEWICNYYDQDANGIPDDQGWVDLLRAQGYTVNVRATSSAANYWHNGSADVALTAEMLGYLNAADLIIYSRTGDSTNYANGDAERNSWNNLTKPVLSLNAPFGQNNRLRWLDNATQTYLPSATRLEVVVPSHPIFTDIPLDASNQVAIIDPAVCYKAGVTSEGLTVLATTSAGNGTLLGRVVGANQYVWIAEWAPGKPFYGGTTANTPGGKRLAVFAGNRENATSLIGRGVYNLNANGQKLFLNAVRYMLGLPVREDVASNPSPSNQATDVVRDVVLSWRPAQAGQTHDVYFGTSLDAVTNASRTTPLGVLVSKDQAATTYDPAGLLDFGKTYYWRIDEIGTATAKGAVWSFTSEPLGYPITAAIKATASSSLTATMGPEKTIDGSGLDAKDEHSTLSTDAWLSKKGDSPVWIQYEFDRPYKLYQMWVWNSNQAVEQAVGFGAKDVKVETSLDGTAWTALANVPEFNQATGEADYVHNTTVDFGGVQAKFVKLTINANWADGTKQAGLSEVRFFYAAVKAFGPSPANAAADVALNGLLNWRPGREAARHDVYLSGDASAVLNGTALVKTVTEHSLALAGLGLEYGRTYAWKVNEVNDAAATKVWEGDVWTFTTVGYAAVDDFESYDDVCNRIFFSWVDGFGYSATPACNVLGAAGNATGSTVGNINPPFAEQATVHSGRQAMPMWFDNTKSPFYSETQHEWQTAQSWTGGGANTLTVWLRGDAPGFLEVSPGTIVMNGTGTDIWNTADQGRFVYKQLTGDGSVTARVESLANTDPWAKAGVMIRQTLDAGSPFAYSVYGGTNGMRFQARLTAAAAAISDSTPAPPAEQTGARAPVWVKVERKGTQFNCYYSTDATGKAWTAMALGPQTIAMPATAFIGLAVTSHTASAVCGARFSSVSTTGNVTGAWQSADLGTAQATTGNSPETFYVAVQDSSGKIKVISSPDPTLICLGDWVAWNIPLSQFSSAGVNLGAVKKIIVGVGDRSSPKSGSAGKLCIDDIRLTRLAP
jgi:hypothetical protein